MKEKLIANQFARMGARFKLVCQEKERGPAQADYAMDIRRDKHGEYFELRVPRSMEPSSRSA